jgi:glycosyltransferase involved in cell wall biosynthesis
MPGLIPLIKSITPDRPVLYRSHIQIRSDLAMTEGSPQADIWQFLWGNIQHADMFISHPIPSFVPGNVPRAKVAYLPATTDWLDGLNKDLNDWDQGYYGHLYNEQCHALRMTELRWPAKKYIIQVARFDPAKGIPDVIESYAEFRRLLAKHHPHNEAPQLVMQVSPRFYLIACPKLIYLDAAMAQSMTQTGRSSSMRRCPSLKPASHTSSPPSLSCVSRPTINS